MPEEGLNAIFGPENTTRETPAPEAPETPAPVRRARSRRGNPFQCSFCHRLLSRDRARAYRVIDSNGHLEPAALEDHDPVSNPLLIACAQCVGDRRRIIACASCGLLAPRHNCDQDNMGMILCPECRPNFTVCSNCGAYHPRSTARSRMDMCPSCYEARAPLYMIHGHDHKPAPIFHPDYEPGVRYAGIEIEMDAINARPNLNKFCRAIRNYDGQFIYLKRDGSLSSEGVEIVSHPMTVEYHKSGVWYDILNAAKTAGYHSHDTTSCGLHIHINKDSLSLYGEERERIIGKMGYLIHRFQPQIFKFSRRDASRWAKFISWNTAGDYFDEYLQYKLYNHNDRYMALNLQNRHTVEFRVFRGTLNYETLMASIEFCDLIADISKEPFERVRITTWNDLKNIAGEYEYLPGYLVKRGL